MEIKRLFSCVKQRPISETRWNIVKENWPFHYKMANYLCGQSKIVETQFKISHRIFATEEKLFKWKKSVSPSCKRCGELDDLYHHFFSCKLVWDFWLKVDAWVISKIETRFPVTKDEFLLGIYNDIDNPVINFVNLVFLLGKDFISESKENISFFIFTSNLEDKLRYFIQSNKKRLPMLNYLD